MWGKLERSHGSLYFQMNFGDWELYKGRSHKSIFLSNKCNVDDVGVGILILELFCCSKLYPIERTEVVVIFVGINNCF